MAMNILNIKSIAFYNHLNFYNNHRGIRTLSAYPIVKRLAGHPHTRGYMERFLLFLQ